MAFCTILEHLTSNKKFSDRATGKCFGFKALPATAIALDTITCIVLAVLAVAYYKGSFGLSCNTLTSGILAGSSLAIGCLVLKQILNAVIFKIGKRNKCSAIDTEFYLIYTHIAIVTIASVIFATLISISISYLFRPCASIGFFENFSFASGGIVGGLFFVNAIISKIKSICCKHTSHISKLL